MRLDPDLRRLMCEHGFEAAVVIAKDVSVVVVGAVESVFRNRPDAEAEAARLSTLYGVEGSFAAEEL
jgi:hypothetical protein